MRSTALTFFSVSLAALASAFTKPVGDTPSGNPIYKPNLGDIVPKGQPYNITWSPTSSGTITLLLLRGPSENVVPLKPIAEGIPNNGSYIWTPDSSLEPDTSRYGIQLIQDSDGAYQYSTQFGISGDASVSSSSSASSSSSSSYYSLSSSSAVISTTTTADTSSIPSSSAPTALPLPTTTFFKYYNGSCHACPPHNQTTTYSNTETVVDAQATAPANPTVIASSLPGTATSAIRKFDPVPTTVPGTSPIAANAAGQMAIPLGTAAMVLAGMFAALLI